jgi:hypothetical protein
VRREGEGAPEERPEAGERATDCGLCRPKTSGLSVQSLLFGRGKH